MTAPAPTAGERKCTCIPGICTEGDECCESHDCPASPPVVAASTGTSEDVETLADSIGAELYQSLMEASADVWRRWEFLTDEAKAKYRAEGGRIVNAAVAPVLAAREAAARAEEREPLIVLDGLLRRWETVPALRRATAAAEVRRALGEHLARIARVARP